MTMMPHSQTTSTIVYRRGTLADLEAFLPLRMAMLREVGMLPDEPHYSELLLSNRRYFQEKIPCEAYLLWVAEVESQIVATSGLLLFERPPTGENPTGLDGYVMNMYTLPQWRGQGIATRLLAMIIEYMRSRRAGRLWLHATPAGKRIYEGFGFSLVNANLQPGAYPEMELMLRQH